MIGVYVKVDEDRASLAFKEARRDMNRRTKAALLAAGEDVALPAAKHGAGNLKVEGQSIAASLVVRARTSSAYLTSTLRGKKGRAVGLLEFGGTVRTKIEPKAKRRGKGGHAPAIRTPYGFRANVSGPRHYRGRFFLTHSVDRHQPQIQESILKQMMRLFDGLEHTP